MHGFSPECVLSAASNDLHLEKPQDIDCKEMVFDLSVILSVPSNDDDVVDDDDEDNFDHDDENSNWP